MGGLLMVYVSGLLCNHNHEQIIYTTIISMTEEKGKAIIYITHMKLDEAFCCFIAVSRNFMMGRLSRILSTHSMIF